MQTGIQLVQGLQQRQIMAPQLQLAMQLMPFGRIQLEQYLHRQVHTNPCISWSSGATLPSASPSDSSYEIALATHHQQPSLRDHLLGQAQLEPVSPVVLLAVDVLIDSLESNGYLRQSLDTVARQSDLSPAPSARQWQAALDLLQRLEPVGVGASDLQHCLLLQLEYAAETDLPPAHNKLAQRIIRFHLDALAGGGSKSELASILDVTVDAIDAALTQIRGLNPNPAADFQHTAGAMYVRPDIQITPCDEDLNKPGWRAELIERLSDKLTLNKTAGADAESWQKARQLLQAIELREQNLQRIADQVTRVQNRFLTHGISHLQPYTQKQLAAELDLHASTISRAVRGKYALHKGQLLPLQDFFSQGLAENKSSASAKACLRQIIAAEDAESPFSDAALCSALEAEGFQLARRTVVKYRQQLGIPNSRER